VKTANFLQRSAPLREQLENIYDQLTVLVDEGLANKQTGHGVEAAAGAVNAAAHLLDLAEKGCDDEEVCP
jgi:hypothetical protein